MSVTADRLNTVACWLCGFGFGACYHDGQTAVAAAFVVAWAFLVVQSCVFPVLREAGR